MSFKSISKPPMHELSVKANILHIGPVGQPALAIIPGSKPPNSAVLYWNKAGQEWKKNCMSITSISDASQVVSEVVQG